MRRRLVNLFTLLSLLLFVAVCVLWVWSERTEHYFWWRPGSNHPAQLVLSRGRLVVNAGVVPLPSLDGPPKGTIAYTTEPADRLGNFDVVPETLDASLVGFGVRLRNGAPVLVLPCWFVAVIAAVLPAARAVRHDRHRLRRSRGLCPACGYDLRTTPEKCPECGAAATAA